MHDGPHTWEQEGERHRRTAEVLATGEAVDVGQLNAIVICLDTLRADIIGPDAPLGDVRTPHLDQLASESVVFQRAFGEGQPTLQTRRSLFTGRRSFPWRYNFDRRGLWHHNPGWHKIPPEQDTLAELLLARGYYTGLIADTYHMFKPTANFSRGFVSYDFLRGQESDNWQPIDPSEAVTALRGHVRDPENWRRYGTLVQYLANQGDRASEEDYQCARVFRRAAEWLQSARRNAPFFLWVDSFDPHEPWDPPRAYADAYFGGTGWQGIDFILPGAAGSMSPEDQARVRALYFGEVTFVDRWVGHLLAAVEALDLWRNTVVILVSDHGTEVGDHGHFGKGPRHMHPYNTQINFMVRHPSGPRGVQLGPFIQTHDLLPTVLSLLELPPAPSDGQDAWRFIRDPHLPGRDHIVCGWADFSGGVTGGRASVRTDQWNYVVTCHAESPGPELYDLARDPRESRNVVAEHPAVVPSLRAHLEALLGASIPFVFQERADPGPSPISEYLGHRRQRVDTL